jgi:aspartate racemase
MVKHIGIVGCSYEGAALCYQTICKESEAILGKHQHPEITLHNLPLNDYMKFIISGQWDKVADLILFSSEKLFKVGANFLITPDNTIHQAFEYVQEKTLLPWLHIGQEVIKVAITKNYKKIGILGTKYLMEGPVYPEIMKKVNIDYCIPDKTQRQNINDIIFNELTYGIIDINSKKYFLSVIDDLKKKMCDSVILGCTEIPLIVCPDDSSLPTLDSTRILARAALRYAIE